MSEIKKNTINQNENQSKYKKEIKEWALSIAIAVIVALFIRAFLFEIVLVEGSSMQPTLYDKERVVMSKLGYILDDPVRGDIVVFEVPAYENAYYIKRIIGMPGDKIKISDGYVYINDQPLNEEYITESSSKDYDEVHVPKGHYFVMGDNRNESKDSRDPIVGFVPLDKIKSKAVIIIWPLDRFSIIKTISND